jgi:hypothetical protein
MALLTVQSINRLGTTVTLAAPSASDTFVATGRTFYYIVVGGTATTVTIVVPMARDVIPNVDISNLVVGPLTSVSKMIGPLPPEIFSDPTTGLVTVTTSNQTSVTAGVFDLSY